MEPSSGRALEKKTDERRIACLLGFFSDFSQDSHIDIFVRVAPNVEISGRV
jgi:hypothetical protein